MMPQSGSPTPAGGNAVQLGSANPYRLSGRQIGAQFNYDRALAAQQGDPRAAAKQYQRGGISSSKGTAMLGAADAGNRYAAGMAQAELGRMQDKYANAGIRLADQAERANFGNALVGLQEQNAQAQWMNQFQNMQNAMASGQSLLSGLL